MIRSGAGYLIYSSAFLRASSAFGRCMPGFAFLTDSFALLSRRRLECAQSVLLMLDDRRNLAYSLAARRGVNAVKWEARLARRARRRHRASRSHRAPGARKSCHAQTYAAYPAACEPIRSLCGRQRANRGKGAGRRRAASRNGSVAAGSPTMRTEISGERQRRNARAYVAAKDSGAMNVPRKLAGAARRVRDSGLPRSMSQAAAATSAQGHYRTIGRSANRETAELSPRGGRRNRRRRHCEVRDPVGQRRRARYRKPRFARDLVRVEQRAKIGDLVGEQPAYLGRSSGSEQRDRATPSTPGAALRRRRASAALRREARRRRARGRPARAPASAQVQFVYEVRSTYGAARCGVPPAAARSRASSASWLPAKKPVCGSRSIAPHVAASPRRASRESPRCPKSEQLRRARAASPA